MSHETYSEKHYYENQENIKDGICINPVMRDAFDMTAHEERDPKELADWAMNPYIVTQGAFEDTYGDYCKRCKGMTDVETEEAFNARIAKDKEDWNKHWVEGIRYDVRCLTGGAWDRSSLLGQFDNIEDAIALAKEEPVNYFEMMAKLTDSVSNSPDCPLLVCK